MPVDHEETPRRRKLKLNMGELEGAFESASWETAYHLDLETGRVLMITDEIRWALERVYEDAPGGGEGEEPIPLVDALERSDLPEWMKEAVQEADQVEADGGTRYIEVPRADSREGYRDMEYFIATVEDGSLQNRLWRALSGRGVFRSFKDVLYDYPRERERWFEFKDARVRQQVLDWLESQGIEPIIEPPPAVEPSPPLPPIRSRLILEVLAFVCTASQLPVVTRIALIGSLTTDEPDPKDADLLVTVTDDGDLASLAKLARKLQGHTQSFQSGADVFLADPRGNYLGRTCPWKRCGPGIRASCDALHCGWRPYLHDDLRTVQLDAALIASPPIELWPQVVTRVSAPEDVQQGLLLPLKGQLE